MTTVFMADTLPRISFFTPDAQATFGNYLTSILYVAMPLFLIWAAVTFGGTLLSVIRDAFSRIMGNREDDYDDEDTRD